MGISGKAHAVDGGLLAEIPLRPPLKPVYTKAEIVEEEGPVTPTAPEARIPASLQCPPAPKKRRASSSKCSYIGVREFFNPPDLETVFIRRAS